MYVIIGWEKRARFFFFISPITSVMYIPEAMRLARKALLVEIIYEGALVFISNYYNSSL